MPSLSRSEFYSNGKRKIKTTKRETTRDRHLFWNDIYSNKNFGLWIECTKCKKWRKSFQFSESHEVPDLWHCSMNKSDDGIEGSCEDPEEDTNEDYLEFCPGSLVWAKLDGYPWWPAMVDEDPDIEEFFLSQRKSDYYHVTFLDEKVSRAWIRTTQISSYLKPPHMHRHLPKHLNRKKYRMLLEKAEVNANAALEMTLKERLEKFSFPHLYKGKFPLAFQPDSSDESECITADTLLKELDSIDSDFSSDSDSSTLKRSNENEDKIPRELIHVVPDAGNIDETGSNSECSIMNSSPSTSGTEKKMKTSAISSDEASETKFRRSSATVPEKNFTKKRKNKNLDNKASKKCSSVNHLTSSESTATKPPEYVDLCLDDDDTLELVIASNKEEKTEANQTSFKCLVSDNPSSNMSIQSSEEGGAKVVKGSKDKLTKKRKIGNLMTNPSEKHGIDTKVVNKHQCSGKDKDVMIHDSVSSVDLGNKTLLATQPNAERSEKCKQLKKKQIKDLKTSPNVTSDVVSTIVTNNHHFHEPDKEVEDIRSCDNDINLPAVKTQNKTLLPIQSAEVNGVKSVDDKKESNKKVLKKKKDLKAESTLKHKTNHRVVMNCGKHNVNNDNGESLSDDKVKVIPQKKTSRIMTTTKTAMAPRANLGLSNNIKNVGAKTSTIVGAAKPKKEKQLQGNKQKVEKAVTKKKDVQVNAEQNISSCDKQIQRNNESSRSNFKTNPKLKPSFKAFKLPLKDVVSKQFDEKKKDFNDTKESQSVGQNQDFGKENSRVEDQVVSPTTLGNSDCDKTCSNAKPPKENVSKSRKDKNFIKTGDVSLPEEVSLNETSGPLNGSAKALLSTNGGNETEIREKIIKKAIPTQISEKIRETTVEDIESNVNKEIESQDEDFFIVSLSDEEF
ncbi:PC4 and SFRS1-interacting protein-like isoform X2 [Parasteatoda tepidariorum]|uniref:PC4 and SFRS1-interacting protein-like isoform X2 n=1 Tax=Parasteatoda tepidariorum TaxID=114398 RepID=UPI001C7229F5|nr:uncharacterized protein LOC107446905 isoform X2 [Parasteatoda tepidariorum]